MNKNNFCALPFNGIFLSANGDIKTCCTSYKKIGNINSQSIDEIIQGPEIKKIRQKIINGEWHENCLQCKKLEDMGSRSERQATLKSLMKFTGASSSTFILEKLDLRWSNLCNLTCTYCFEDFSSNWAAIKGIKVNANKSDVENSLLELIAKSRDSIQEVLLLGGEPLLQKQNAKLLDILQNKNTYVLSNLAIDLENNKIARQLLDNPAAHWGISFETIKDRYEYVRHGASWQTFYSNLKFLKQHKARSINAHPLYCVYSAFNLIEYYNFIIDSSLFDAVYWYALHNIDGLNVHSLPKDMKLKALQELDRCIEKFESTGPDINGLKNLRQGLILSMDNNQNNTKSFFSWVETLENKQLRKTVSFSDLWPEIIMDFKKNE